MDISMDGHTIKVVLIGSAGVGKTSLRQQYITARFATGYRATIGTDFITKTIPHYSWRPSEAVDMSSSQPPMPTNSEEPHEPSRPPSGSVTLQIWDTAGQERFSSLSSAFFRGADAVLLVFDVNKPETLRDLERWWNDFRVKVPIPVGEEANFCVVAVGNKMDLVSTAKGQDIANRSMAEDFLNHLVPSTSHPEGPPASGARDSPEPMIPDTEASANSGPPRIPIVGPSKSGSISHQFYANQFQDDNTEDAQVTPKATQGIVNSAGSRFGTMASSKTGRTVYHTPSSSMFDSPNPAAMSSLARQPRRPSSDSENLEFDYNHDLGPSSSSLTGYGTANSRYLSDAGSGPSRIGSVASDSSLLTVIPSRPHQIMAIPFMRPTRQRTPQSLSRTSTVSSRSSLRHGGLPNADLPTPSASPPSPPTLTASLMATLQQTRSESSEPLDTGVKIFFTSAKLDSGPSITPISQVFAYVAERVVRRWEREEEEARLVVESGEQVEISSAGRSRFKLAESWNQLKSLRGGCC